MTVDVAKLRRHRELGVSILMDSRKATPKTADEIVKRIHTWERNLIPLMEHFGDGVAALPGFGRETFPHRVGTAQKPPPGPGCLIGLIHNAYFKNSPSFISSIGARGQAPFVSVRPALRSQERPSAI